MEARNGLERSVLLGLIPLLGLTSGLFAAVAGIFSVAACSLVLWIVDRAVRRRAAVEQGYAGGVRWTLLGVMGFALSWWMGMLTPFLLPLAEREVTILMLAGLTPLVFHAAVTAGRGKASPLPYIHFVVLMLIMGIVREVLGRGTLAGFVVFGYVTPSAMFQGPFGAFLILGVVVLLVRVRSLRQNDQEEKRHA